jgi:hypothetical protein
MVLRCSPVTRVAYVMCLLGPFIPYGLSKSGWVGLTLGQGQGGWLQVVTMLSLFFIVIRSWQVLSSAGRLDAFRASQIVFVLRVLGLLVMYAGALTVLVSIFGRWLVPLIFKGQSEDGIEFYVVGVYLALAMSAGSSGVMLFEFSRMLGFERHMRDADS